MPRLLPRFGLSTLFAAMLFCVSLAGWWRYEFERGRQERAALQALTDEGIDFAVIRASDGYSMRGRQDKGWFEGLGRRTATFVGASDPAVELTVSDLVTDATRRRLFDLPALRDLTLHGFDMMADGKTYAAPPSAERALGRALPPLPSEIAMTDEPPPAMHGASLSDDERLVAERAVILAWRTASGPPRALGHAGFEGEDAVRRVYAFDGDRSWHLRRSSDPIGISDLLVGDGKSGVDRYWNKGEWRTARAVRTPDDRRVPAGRRSAYPIDPVAASDSGTTWKLDPFVTYFAACNAGSASSGAERLDDGGYRFRVHGSSLEVGSSFFGDAAGATTKLVDVDLIVGPAPNYRLQRIDVVAEDNSQPFVMRRCDVIEYAEIGGYELPSRQFTWIRDTPQILGPFGETLPDKVVRRQTRYGWELDPELPADLFEPARNGAEFFTAEPSSTFRWWYLTGGLGIAALAFLAGRGAWRRFAGRRRRDSPTEIGVARSDPPT